MSAMKQEEKLYAVKNSLASNSNVIIGAIEGLGLEDSLTENYNLLIPSIYSPGKYVVDFLVAPKKGLYTGGELQEFMMNLIPNGMTPDSITNFFQFRNGSMNFGHLIFYELLGKKKTTKEIISSYKRMCHLEGLVDGKKKVEEKTEDVFSCIKISPYPSEAYIKDILDDNVYSYYVEAEILAEYKNMSRKDKK